MTYDPLDNADSFPQRGGSTDPLHSDPSDPLNDAESYIPGKGNALGVVDRYELNKQLGAGSFGEVYQAWDTVSRTPVAIKMIPDEVARDDEEMEEVRYNFGLTSRLKHPHIASLNHLHQVEKMDAKAQQLGFKRGDFLVIMEYALGVTLFAWRRSFAHRMLPVDKAIAVCRQIADALDYAHKQRIIHRDIKPKNVMVAVQPVERQRSEGQKADSLSTDNRELITDNCTVKVLDFGLAADIRSSLSRKSKEGKKYSSSGTSFYMSPEQWQGLRQGPQSDQYALAVLFYELVSGEVPFQSVFQSDDRELMLMAVVNNPVESLEVLDEQQNAVLQRALAKNPDERFASCGDFVAALAGGRISRKGAAGAKKKSLVVGALAGVLAVGGFFVWQDRDGSPSRSESNVDGVSSSVVQQRQGVSATPQQVIEENRNNRESTLTAEESAQIHTLLSEARSSLSTGDLDTATEKAQAVLSIFDGNVDALNVLTEIEEKAGERTARTEKVDAEMAFEKLERDITDRKQGFEEQFTELTKQLKIAQDAYEHESWGQAFSAYKGVLVECETLRALDDDREDAKTQRSAAEQQQKAAKSAEADELAGDAWSKAVESALRAEQQFEKGDFEAASTGWKTAAEQFDSSRILAVAVKVNWDSATTEHNEEDKENQQYSEGESVAAETTHTQIAQETAVVLQSQDAPMLPPKIEVLAELMREGTEDVASVLPEQHVVKLSVVADQSMGVDSRTVGLLETLLVADLCENGIEVLSGNGAAAAATSVEMTVSHCECRDYPLAQEGWKTRMGCKAFVDVKCRIAGDDRVTAKQFTYSVDGVGETELDALSEAARQLTKNLIANDQLTR